MRSIESLDENFQRMKEFPLNIRNATQLKAVLGVTPTVFDKLVTAFDAYVQAEQNARYYVMALRNRGRAYAEQ